LHIRHLLHRQPSSPAPSPRSPRILRTRHIPRCLRIHGMNGNESEWFGRCPYPCSGGRTPFHRRTGTSSAAKALPRLQGNQEGPGPPVRPLVGGFPDAPVLGPRPTEERTGSPAGGYVRSWRRIVSSPVCTMRGNTRQGRIIGFLSKWERGIFTAEPNVAPASNKQAHVRNPSMKRTHDEGPFLSEPWGGHGSMLSRGLAGGGFQSGVRCCARTRAGMRNPGSPEGSMSGHRNSAGHTKAIHEIHAGVRTSTRGLRLLAKETQKDSMRRTASRRNVSPGRRIHGRYIGLIRNLPLARKRRCAPSALRRESRRRSAWPSSCGILDNPPVVESHRRHSNSLAAPNYSIPVDQTMLERARPLPSYAARSLLMNFCALAIAADIPFLCSKFLTSAFCFGFRLFR